MLKLVANPAPVLTSAQVVFGVGLRLFCRAAVMSCLQSSGVVLLANRSWWCILTGIAISYLWIGNTRDSVDYRQRSVRIAYALGGGSGAGLVLAVARWLG